MANEKRLIDAEALCKEIEKRLCEPCKAKGRDYHGVACRACWVDDMRIEIEDAPTVDAVEIPDCKMCEFNYTLNWHQCEGCFGNARNNFTPRMDGGNEDGNL